MPLDATTTLRYSLDRAANFWGEDMPIYEYECPICGVVFSELLPIGAPAPVCPRCGEGETRKRLSRFAVGRTEAQRGAALTERAAGVDRRNRREMAHFFQEVGGDVSDPFREVVDRAAAGATEAEMADVVRDVPVRSREQALAGHHETQ